MSSNDCCAFSHIDHDCPQTSDAVFLRPSTPKSTKNLSHGFHSGGAFSDPNVLSMSVGPPMTSLPFKKRQSSQIEFPVENDLSESQGEVNNQLHETVIPSSEQDVTTDVYRIPGMSVYVSSLIIYHLKEVFLVLIIYFRAMIVMMTTMIRLPLLQSRPTEKALNHLIL